MKTNYNKISYPKFVIKFKLNKEWVNILHTKKVNRISYRIRQFGTDFKWDKCFLKFYYDKKYTNEGYYYNTKDLLHAFICFKEILVEFN